MLLKYATEEQSGCGLLSQQAAISDKTDSTGLATATATYAVTNCVLDFGSKTKISEDCLGNETFASGKVKLNSKQIRHGISTSHKGHYAVIPWPNNQVEFELDVTEFDNYKVWVSNRSESLSIISGQALARITINLSHDPNTGFCTIPTPEVSVKYIRYKDSLLELPGPFGRFQVAVQDSDISAQHGTFGDLTNHLSGKMIVWGEEVSVPSDKRGLDPNYDASQHLESFRCRLGDKTKLPHYECNAKKELITHAARLLVLNTAMVVKESHAEKSAASYTSCGFDRLMHKLVSCNGDHRLITVSDCTIGYAHGLPEFYERDCASDHLYMLGQAKIVGGRMFVHEQCWALSDYRTRSDSITFFLDSVKFTNFAAYYLAHEQSGPLGKLLIREGELEAIIKPLFAENRTRPGRMDIATPVAIFEKINLKEATAELWLNPSLKKDGDFAIILNIKNSQLSAQNGLFRGIGNYLSGNITVNDELHQIDEVVLNPDFSSHAFDLSYACHPDLMKPL